MRVTSKLNNIKTYSKMLIALKVGLLLVFFIGLPVSVSADTYSATNFQILDPVISAGAERGTSNNFILLQSLSEIGLGLSTSDNFKLNPGFLTYPIATAASNVSATAGDGKATISWTAGTGALGWTVSGYTIGKSTTSGGPYTNTSVGNVTSNTQNGLTNGTMYYFVVQSEDAFSNIIATSTEVSATPATDIITTQTNEMSTTDASSATLTDDNNTKLTLTIPANVLSSGVTLNRKISSISESTVTATRQLPSSKLSSNTMFEIAFTSTVDDSSVTSFDKAITLTFTYRDADVSDINESTLAAYRWNGSSWEVLSGSNVNTANNTVSVTSTDFSFFGLLGEAPSSNGGVVSAPSVSSSGSGGRTTVGPWLTSVVFNGTAYPGSMVTILKNAQLKALKRVPSNGRFSISVPDIAVGTHNFGIWAEDADGHRSITRSFTVQAKYGESVSIGGIVLPPTISTDKEEVRIDDSVEVFGMSAPGSKVEIYTDDNAEALAEIHVEDDGVWKHKISGRLFEQGEHAIRARTYFGGVRSTFSQKAAVTVGLKNVLRQKPRAVPERVDFNSDNKVNLVDFSIAAFWYKQPSPPAHVDTNKDGKVDLVDFSILAYYWTG